METILKFTQVSFDFGFKKSLLDEVSFSMRRGMKVALMGQNGAGKSTLFKLITGELKPTSGTISYDKKCIVATARQVIPSTEMKLSVEEYFSKSFATIEKHELRKKIAAVLDIVNLSAPLDKIISSFSGGQQARLLLASALIQNPDLLLLDEPTNNLDYTGIAHLTDFLVNYPKSVIVISHDTDFLNAFTEGVLYLDSFKKKIEQYAGDYDDVLEQIAARIEKERQLNARMQRGIQENKDKSNFFAHKGGGLRAVAKKMREKAAKMESEMVEVRRDDKTIRPFTIPTQDDLISPTLKITSFTIMKNHVEIEKQTDIVLGKNRHLLITGPNGIGKSTFIDSLVSQTARGVYLSPDVRIGVYRQDFSMLDFDDTVFESFTKATLEAGSKIMEGEIRSVAAGFLITNEYIHAKIGSLSEGQKGLVSFARLVLQKPGLLILDEPTNHINFRHIPHIATALDQYQGMMILVSHVWEFVSQIRIDLELDMEK